MEATTVAEVQALCRTSGAADASSRVSASEALAKYVLTATAKGLSETVATTLLSSMLEVAPSAYKSIAPLFALSFGSVPRSKSRSIAFTACDTLGKLLKIEDASVLVRVAVRN